MFAAAAAVDGWRDWIEMALAGRLVHRAFCYSSDDNCGGQTHIIRS